MLNREEWLLLVNEYKQSGQTNIKAFSTSRQVGYQAFRYWLQKSSLENGEVVIHPNVEKSKGKLLPVMIQGNANPKLHLNVNEVDVFLEANFDVSLLKRVVTALKEC